MKKGIVKIQIFQTIFVVILFIIALLEKRSILNNNLMAFYTITIIAFCIIMDVVTIIYMKKNKHKEKEYFINLIFITIELVILGFFCGSIDYYVDKVEFSKHCAATKATVYNVDKDIRESYGKVNRYEYTTSYTYYFSYIVDGEAYQSDFNERKTSSNARRSSAKQEAERVKPKYKENDTFILYYNIEEPTDWRMNITHASNKTIYIIGTVAIIFQAFCLVKATKKYKKEDKI